MAGVDVFIFFCSGLGAVFALMNFYIIQQTKINPGAGFVNPNSPLNAVTAELKKVEDIHATIELGAKAFLRAEYTICVHGLCGMMVAVNANARDGGRGVGAAEQARGGVRVAFSNAVIGYALCAMGLATLLLLLLCYKTHFATVDTWNVMMDCAAGFGLAGSSVAMFGSVGGGIYTIFLDVGADLVGKVVHGLEEDDPKNPATIADNVGDNVGVPRGMGSDLFGYGQAASRRWSSARPPDGRGHMGLLKDMKAADVVSLSLSLSAAALSGFVLWSNLRAGDEPSPGAGSAKPTAEEEKKRKQAARCRAIETLIMERGHEEGVLREFKKGDIFFNYGCFPRTWEDPRHVSPDTGYPGDNDPLDVCEIGLRQIQTGEIRAVKVLGVLAMIDDDETDWKIVAIDAADRWASELNDVGDVERLLPGTVSLIREWFRTYKIPDGKPPNKFALGEECKGAAYAHKVIHETHEAWVNLVKTQVGADFGFQLQSRDAATSTSTRRSSAPSAATTSPRAARSCV
ncbi:inorganic diphosphatase [Aureococcus anophagefferens]|nr:inorganic diphosphatase [Aureococcus anophagefferens]